MIEQTIGNPYIYYFKRFFYFLKYFGLSKAIKASYYYIHRNINQKKLDVVNKQLVKLDKYELSVIPNDIGISSELRIYKTHEPLITSIRNEWSYPWLYHRYITCSKRPILIISRYDYSIYYFLLSQNLNLEIS